MDSAMDWDADGESVARRVPPSRLRRYGETDFAGVTWARLDEARLKG